MGIKAKDLSGTRYGRFTAKYRVGTTKPAMWMCACDCGVEKLVWDADLKRGKSKSCGCLQKELWTLSITTHGMTGTREYISWLHIVQRCTNPNHESFHGYGGRGITITQEWRDDFSKFYNEIGECPGQGYSVDRIDNNKGYEPGNVRWATPEIQANNTSSVRFFHYHGERLTIRQALNKSGSTVPMNTVDRRLREGMSLDAAIDTPLDMRRSLNARGRR
jgi:hypothetical protein